MHILLLCIIHPYPPWGQSNSLSLSALSFFNTYLDKLLALYDPGLVFEEPSSGNDREDDKVDLLADLPQFSIPMFLQSSLQVLPIKHLRMYMNVHNIVDRDIFAGQIFCL